MTEVQQEALRVRRRTIHCAAVHSNTSNGADMACGYDTLITCDDCKYSAGWGRKDPQAKCNQPKQ